MIVCAVDTNHRALKGKMPDIRNLEGYLTLGLAISTRQGDNSGRLYTSICTNICTLRLKISKNMRLRRVTHPILCHISGVRR